MSDDTQLVDAVSQATGYGHLTVRCALTRCYEDRARSAVGEAGIKAIRDAAKKHGWALSAHEVTPVRECRVEEVGLQEVFG